MLLLDGTLLKLDDVYKKHSVYRNVINYVSLNTEHLISIINNSICMGPSRVKIKKDINFIECNKQFPNIIHIKNDLEQIIQSNEYEIWENNKFHDCKEINIYNLQEICQSLNILIEIEKRNLFPNDKINNYILKIIDDSLLNYSKTLKIEELKNIIGIGPGLTPFGDDVLCGFVLCKNYLNFDRKFNNKIAEYSKINTTTISSNLIINICNCEYSDDISQFSNSILVDHKASPEFVQKILNFVHL